MRSKARPILVPIDFSAHSREAAAYAGNLARRLRAPMVILHVAHDPGEAPGYYDKIRKKKKKAVSRIEDKAREAMAAFVGEVVAEHPELERTFQKAGTTVVVGLPVTRILEVVDRLDPAMVVMGSLGRTGLARLYIGSKAEQVVRLCPAPVTIVKTTNA